MLPSEILASYSLAAAWVLGPEIETDSKIQTEILCQGKIDRNVVRKPKPALFILFVIWNPVDKQMGLLKFIMVLFTRMEFCLATFARGGVDRSRL